MNRRAWLLSALALAGCGAAPADIFPETVASVWRRSTLATALPADAPDPVRRQSVSNIVVATYEGPGRLQARAYEMTSSAVALETAQQWTPSADTVMFNRDRHFIVVHWTAADRKAVEAFVREINSRLAPK